MECLADQRLLTQRKGKIFFEDNCYNVVPRWELYKLAHLFEDNL